MLREAGEMYCALLNPDTSLLGCCYPDIVYSSFICSFLSALYIFFPVTSPDISFSSFILLILHGFVLLSASPSREPSFTRNHHFVLLVLPDLGLAGLGPFAGLPNPKLLEAKDMHIDWWMLSGSHTTIKSFSC